MKPGQRRPSKSTLRMVGLRGGTCLCIAIAASGCGGGGSSAPPAPITQTFAPTDDTFINSGHPDNNNGASLSIFTGVDGQGGVMRGLIRFAMPPALQRHATVTNVQLKMTVRALGNETAGPGAVESLRTVGEPWTAGNGIGDAQMMFVVGEACGGAVSGATWNQPNCASGTATSWSTPGGTVVAIASGQVNTAGVAVGGQVVWDSAAAANTGMNSDVQSWIDTPGGNHGWRISSSDEMTAAAAQRFYSADAGGTTAPTLTVVYIPIR